MGLSKMKKKNKHSDNNDEFLDADQEFHDA
jgi:hypothetical protein